MSKVVVVAGYGPGISAAVARKFGKEGFKVALLARTEAKLTKGAAELIEEGIVAKGFAVDLSKPDDVRRALASVQEELGPVTVLHYNAYCHVFKELLDYTDEDWQDAYNLNVIGLVAAVRAVVPGFSGQADTAILVTGGGLSLENDVMAQLAVDFKFTAQIVAKAAQRKTVALLNKALGPQGTFVGEVTVTQQVKGTPFDVHGSATLSGEEVALAFWNLYREKGTWVVQI